MLATSTYEDVANLRSVVADMAGRLQEAATLVDARERHEELGRLRERMASDNLRIMFCGEFKRGKSTLINSMLGHRVLPAWATPTTAIISEVHYSEQPRARLYHLDDPAMAIPVDVMELDSFVTIDEDDDDANNPYERAEIGWPLPLCARGVTVIDSPGLNEDPRREEITLNYLQRADVLVFVFDCTAAMSQSERLFLQSRALASGATDIFFVGNKINQVDEDERERVRRVVGRRIGDLVGPTDKIFFVNARGALDARIEQGPAEEYGVPALERALEVYLSDEPGRRRIAGALRLIQYSAQELARSVEQSRRLLEQDRELLRRRYEEQREPLQTLEQQRSLILSRLAAHTLETRQLVEERMREKLFDVATMVPTWAESFTPGTRMRMNPVKVRQQLDSRVQEVVEHLSERAQLEVADWQGKELNSLIEMRMASLESEIGANIDAFLGHIEEIRCQLTLGTAEVQVNADGATASGGERLLAAAAGYLLTGGSVVEGALFGFKGLGKSMVTTIAVAVGLALLHFGPQGIILGMFSAGLLRSAMKLDRVNKQVVHDVADQVAEHIRSSAYGQAKQTGSALEDGFAGLRGEVEIALEGRIAELRREVENVLAESDRTDQEKRMRQDDLRRSIDELLSIEAEAREKFDMLARI